MTTASNTMGLRYRLAPLIIPAAFIGFWEIAVRLGGHANILLPPPSRVLETLFDLIRTGTLFDHIGASLFRVATGYVVSVIVGVPLGLAMGYWLMAERLMSTTVNGLRPIRCRANQSAVTNASTPIGNNHCHHTAVSIAQRG